MRATCNHIANDCDALISGPVGRWCPVVGTQRTNDDPLYCRHHLEEPTQSGFSRTPKLSLLMG